MNTARISLTGTSALIYSYPAGTAAINLMIRNRDATNSVFVGNSAVDTNAFEIPAGSTIELVLTPLDSVVWGVTAGATVSIDTIARIAQ